MQCLNGECVYCTDPRMRRCGNSCFDPLTQQCCFGLYVQPKGPEIQCCGSGICKNGDKCVNGGCEPDTVACCYEQTGDTPCVTIRRTSYVYQPRAREACFNSDGHPLNADRCEGAKLQGSYVECNKCGCFCGQEDGFCCYKKRM